MTNTIPDAPCMDYLPTLGEKWPHSKGNVGKYSLHGASGNLKFSKKQSDVFCRAFAINL